MSSDIMNTLRKEAPKELVDASIIESVFWDLTNLRSLRNSIEALESILLNPDKNIHWVDRCMRIGIAQKNDGYVVIAADEVLPDTLRSTLAILKERAEYIRQRLEKYGIRGEIK